MNWLQKLSQSEYPGYHQIGQGGDLWLSPRILWVYDGQIKQTQKYPDHYSWRKSGEIGVYSAVGRIDIKKNLGSCDFGNLSDDEKLKIMDALTSTFPGVQFIIQYSGKYDSKRSMPLRDYYNQLSEEGYGLKSQ
jgi:hypothetical protein